VSRIGWYAMEGRVACARGARGNGGIVTQEIPEKPYFFTVFPQTNSAKDLTFIYCVIILIGTFGVTRKTVTPTKASTQESRAHCCERGGG
jgi:hypothetical protein